MLAIAETDSRRYIIPNELTGAAFALALLRAGIVGPEADCLHRDIGGLAGSGASPCRSWP